MQVTSSHSILLGGIGGDSHSVGLTILRQALVVNGYQVCYLGIQNPLELFLCRASLYNVLMISSMDGHARRYLHNFAELKQQYQPCDTLCYLGGNLHIGDAAGYEDEFLAMGFDRVFVKFVDISTVLDTLKHDLHNVPSKTYQATVLEHIQGANYLLPLPVSDEVLEISTFRRIRCTVLEQWRTGQQARNLEENANYLSRQASFAQVQADVNVRHAPILIQPRSGVPVLPEQIQQFKTFERSGCRVLSYQVDSLTRNNYYRSAEEAIKECNLSENTTINGFPVVNYGVPSLRRVMSEVHVPLQIRHSTRDARLLAEISYAGGITSFEGGAICYNIPYYKDYPLDESIHIWQYIDRLTGLYFEKFGIILDREFFGTLTGTLIPPSLAIVVNIIEAILAVQQGVKCLSLGYAEQGNRIQDIAAIRTLAQLPRKILNSLGYQHLQINTVFHQYMAAFPQSFSRAEDLIYNSGITAALSQATRVLIKTPVEAYRIPCITDNVRALKLVTAGVIAAKHTQINEELIIEECSIIQREVLAILERVVFSVGGCIAQNVINSFKEGIIDIPFSPSRHNRGEVVTARDHTGAVRFLAFGNLPFDRELREFHQEKMQERYQADGLFSKTQSYLLVERDVLQISRGEYQQWPLS